MSGVSWAEVVGWDGVEVDRVATLVGRWVDSVGVFADGVRVGGGGGEVSGWMGEGAAAAVARGALLSRGVGGVEAELVAAKLVLARASVQVSGVMGDVRAVYGFASGQHLVVGDDGTVTDGLGVLAVEGVVVRQGLVDECVALMQAVLDRAAQVEVEVASALEAVAPKSFMDRVSGWVDDVQAWCGEHAKDLRQVGEVVSTVGKVLVGVGAVLAVVGVAAAGVTGGWSLLLLPAAGGLASAGGVLWGAGDGLATAADWGEGKLSTSELMTRMAMNAVIAVVPFGAGKVISKLPPVRRALDRAAAKAADVLERKLAEQPWFRKLLPGPLDPGVGPKRWLPSLKDKLAARKVQDLADEESTQVLEQVTQAAREQGITEAPTKILDDMVQERVAVASKDPNWDHVAQDHVAAVEAEVHITDRMKEIAGDNLVGLNNSTKTLDSLQRKVASDMVTTGKSVDEALGGIKDSVRYTVKIPANKYSAKAQDIMDSMKAKGFEPVDYKNTWTNQAREDGLLPGINSKWRDPETGRVFEVQIHTEASYVAREATHEMYDFRRIPGLDSALKSEIDKAQTKVFKSVATPSGAEGVLLR